MEQTGYQFQDFLMQVPEEYEDFVHRVHGILSAAGCKVKIGSSKTNLFSVKYTQGRRGVFNFMLRKRGFKASVYAANFAAYPDVLNRLPEGMVRQLAKTAACKNMASPPTCWDGCVGYDIPIGDERYQKCKFGCFQFDVDSESMPFLLEMLERELQARQAG